MAEPYVVPGTHTWLEGDLRVVLAVPPGASGPVPLVLLLDGQALMLTATEYARVTSLVTLGTLPPVAVVGVWRETDPFDYMTTRFRDFTPYAWELPEPFAADNAMARYGTGGAAAYLDLLVDRVLPAVRDIVEVSDVAIGGWSLSGLFAAWAWRERPDVFKDLIAISPSLWWHHARMLDEGLTPRPGARAIVTAGEREEGDMTKVWPQMFAHAPQREFAGMIRYAEQFSRMLVDAEVATQFVVFPDEHHVTVGPASLARAMHHLYAKP